MYNPIHSYEQAKKAYNEGHYKEAFTMFSELIVKDSRKTDYLLWLGKIYLKVNKIVYAKKCFKEILSRTNELSLKEEAKQLLTTIDKNTASVNRISQSRSNVKINKSTTNPLLTNSGIRPPKKISVITDNNSKNFDRLNLGLPNKKKQKLGIHFFKKLNLKTKITFILIVLGVSPILIASLIIYNFANNFIFTQIQAEKQAKVLAITDKVNRFLLERYSNIQTLASIPAFRDFQIGELYTLQQKQILLNDFLDTYSFYDNVAVFNTQGKLLVQSSGKKLDNYSDRSFFQKALNTSNPVISGPEISRSSGDLVLHFAAPIKNRYKGHTVGVVISRVPVRYIEDLIREFGTLGDQYYLVNQENKIFISQLRQYLRQDAGTNFPDFNQFKRAKQVGFKAGQTLIAYAPFNKLEGLPQQNWSAIISTPTEFAFVPQQQLLLNTVIITGLTALIVVILAVILSTKGSASILNIVNAIQQLARGNLEVRLAVEGEDEVAELGNNINLISSKIQLMLAQIKKEHLEVEKLRNHALATAEQHRKQQELIQDQLLELQEIVERAAAGDLTVRAKVQDGAIGIIGDFLNLIIESWQELIIQFKKANSQVNISVDKNKVAMRNLTNELNQQSMEVINIVKEFNEINYLIQELMSNVSQAPLAVTTTGIIKSNRDLIEYTVESTLAKHKSIAITSEKIKHLSESSQQISNTVIIINDIALQTKLLAVNAEIKAAHTDKEQQEFSLLAEQITPLAIKCANTTYELEQQIKTIQLETKQIVEAINVEAAQLVEESQLALNSKENFNKIIKEVYQLNDIVNLVLSSPLLQNESVQSFTQSIHHLLQRSQCTLNSSEELSRLIQETTQLAQTLQILTNDIKVD